MRDEYRWLGERSRGRDNREREREEKRGNQPESVTMINDMYLVERQWPNYKKKNTNDFYFLSISIYLV